MHSEREAYRHVRVRSAGERREPGQDHLVPDLVLGPADQHDRTRAAEGAQGMRGFGSGRHDAGKSSRDASAARVTSGETADFELTPDMPGELILEIGTPPPASRDPAANLQVHGTVRLRVTDGSRRPAGER